MKWPAWPAEPRIPDQTLPAQTTHRGSEQALPGRPSDRPRPGTAQLTAILAPASAPVQVRHPIRLPAVALVPSFLASLRVIHLDQQCWLGVTGMLRKVP
jgi:hypothetical protein